MKVTHQTLLEAIKNIITPELVEAFNNSFKEYEVDTVVKIEDLHNPLNWEIGEPSECDGSLWDLPSTLGRDIRYLPLEDELVGIQGEIFTDSDDKKILDTAVYPE